MMDGKDALLLALILATGVGSVGLLFLGRWLSRDTRRPDEPQ